MYHLAYFCGGYFSIDGTGKTTHMTIGQNSELVTVFGINSFLRGVPGASEFDQTGYFHKHISIYDYKNTRPSNPQDFDHRDRVLKVNPSMRFFILTKSSYPNKFEYKTWPRP